MFVQFLQEKEERVRVIFTRPLNVASVWDLPVLFCVENNGYGLSTPTFEQYKCKHIADKGTRLWYGESYYRWE